MSAAQRRWLLPFSTLLLMAGILLGRGMETWLWSAAGMAAAGGAALFARGRGRMAAVLAAVLCLGSAAGQTAYHPRLPENGTHEVCGVVAQEFREGKHGQRKTVLRSVTVDGKPLHAGAYWTFYSDELPEGLAPGVTVTVQARTYEPSGADNPGGFDFREYLLQQSVTLGVYGKGDLVVTQDRFSLYGWAASVRSRLTKGLLDVMGEEAGGYAATMLLGVRDLVQDEDREAFQSLGIAHVLSVSGYHVGVLTMLLAGLWHLLRLPRRARPVLMALILGGYALLTGLHAPVVRATLLVLLGEVGVLCHRRRVSLHLLCASACVLLLVNPAQLTGVSFQLTYAALLGLTLVTPWLSGLLVCKTRWRQQLWQALCAGIGAQLGLLLPEMYWFQSLPVIGIAVNLVAMAVMQLVLAGCWVTLAVMAVPGLGWLAGQASAAMLGLLLRVIRLTGSAPWLLVWTKQAGLLAAMGCLLLLAALSFLWRPGVKRRAIAVAAGLVLTIVGSMPWPHHGADYTQLSVGNADAAVLHDRDMVCVIDTGEDGRTLATYLRQRRLSIDCLILTHLHTDHAGGVRDLLDAHIPIARCVVPDGARTADVTEEVLLLLDELAQRGVPIEAVARGDELPLPDGSLTVLWPEPGTDCAGEDVNLYSMAMLAQVRGTTLLLTGDLDGANEMQAAQPADVLKAAHHGSKGSTTPEFLAAVAPQAVIVSGNDMSRLNSMKKRAGETPVYGTQAQGAIRLALTDDGFFFEKAR